MSIKDKLLNYSKFKGYSINSFCKKMGIASTFFARDGGITTDKLEAILYNCKDLSAEWLLRGEGEMLRKPDTGGVHQTSTSGDNLNHSTKVEASETLHEQAKAITALVETQAALVRTNAAIVETNREQSQQIGKLIDRLG